MNTKRFFFILSAFLFSFTVKGQAYINPDIQASLNAYIDFSNTKQWDKAFDLLYPKLFTKVAKQDLVDLMLGMEADGMSLKMSNVRITSTSVPVQEGTETFIRIEYTADLAVAIQPNGLYDSPKAIEAINQQFESTYGDKNVKVDQDNKTYSIIAHKAMMAIDSGDHQWKLVEINMDQPELMQFLFSPSIMDELVRLE